MARIIQFFPKQMYMGNNGDTLENMSDIFEVTDVDRLDAELQVFGMSTTGMGISVTSEVWQTSDPTFMNTSWKKNAGTTMSVSNAATGVVTGVFSGLARFVRAKLIVTSGIYTTAYFVATAREP